MFQSNINKYYGQRHWFGRIFPVAFSVRSMGGLASLTHPVYEQSFRKSIEDMDKRIEFLTFIKYWSTIIQNWCTILTVFKAFYVYSLVSAKVRDLFLYFDWSKTGETVISTNISNGNTLQFAPEALKITTLLSPYYHSLASKTRYFFKKLKILDIWVPNHLC